MNAVGHRCPLCEWRGCSRAPASRVRLGDKIVPFDSRVACVRRDGGILPRAVACWSQVKQNLARLKHLAAAKELSLPHRGANEKDLSLRSERSAHHDRRRSLASAPRHEGFVPVPALSPPTEPRLHWLHLVRRRALSRVAEAGRGAAPAGGSRNIRTRAASGLPPGPL
jgi:hypothetical protein